MESWMTETRHVLRWCVRLKGRNIFMGNASHVTTKQKGEKEPVKIAEFEKISFGQYISDMKDFNSQEEIEDIYDSIKLPVRKTRYSAGHDFHMPFGVKIPSGGSITVPTGIRCKMADNYVMLIFPRSSLGIKNNMAIANTIPVIDSDYYMNGENEGHIYICIKNCGNKMLELDAGEAFAQAVFVEYGVADNGDIENERTGGIGSTGK